MKKLFLVCLLLSLAMLNSYAKKIKVSVTPSDAKIYVDGNYYGDGTVVVDVKKSEEFVSLKMESEGYITKETKLYYKDKRKAVSYGLIKNPLYEVANVSGKANKYFSVSVSRNLYKVQENGKVDLSNAWKIIHQIILNYFEEIQITDVASGFIQTAWEYKRFPEADKIIRTRVSVKQSGIDENLMFQIKVTTEMGSLNSRNEETYKEVPYILRDLEPIISEFQVRLSE